MRARAESRLLDTCRITKPGEGEPTLDPTTLEYVDPAPVVVYEGACRIPKRTTGSSSSTSRGGDASWSVGEFPLNLPFDDDSAEVRPGYQVEYLTSADNPTLVGRIFGLTEVDMQSQATGLRCVMKAVTR